jgi:hypothetical protein
MLALSELFRLEMERITATTNLFTFGDVEVVRGALYHDQIVVLTLEPGRRKMRGAYRKSDRKLNIAAAIAAHIAIRATLKLALANRMPSDAASFSFQLSQSSAATAER